MPAVSIYFEDPDGHSIEFISILDDPPRPELDMMTWPEWEELQGKGKRICPAAPAGVSHLRFNQP